MPSTALYDLVYKKRQLFVGFTEHPSFNQIGNGYFVRKHLMKLKKLMKHNAIKEPDNYIPASMHLSYYRKDY